MGLADEIVDRCFTGTTSRLRGTDFTSLYMDIHRLHQKAFPSHTQVKEGGVIVVILFLFHIIPLRSISYHIRVGSYCFCCECLVALDEGFVDCVVKLD